MTDEEGRQVIRKVHLAFWPDELKSSYQEIINIFLLIFSKQLSIETVNTELFLASIKDKYLPSLTPHPQQMFLWLQRVTIYC